MVILTLLTNGQSYAWCHWQSGSRSVPLVGSLFKEETWVTGVEGTWVARLCSVEKPRPPPHSTMPPALCQPLGPCGTNRTAQDRGAGRAGRLARGQTSFK